MLNTLTLTVMNCSADFSLSKTYHRASQFLLVQKSVRPIETLSTEERTGASKLLAGKIVKVPLAHKCDRLTKTLGLEVRSLYENFWDKRAIALACDNVDAYYARGLRLALQEERKQKAIQAYQKAAELYQKEGKTDYSQSARNKIEEQLNF